MKRYLYVAAALSTAATASAAERVTVDNFNRAETHHYMRSIAAGGCFGKLCHARRPHPVNAQNVIRLNRDTPYSGGVFDLTSPVTIEMPDAGKRFQSMIAINEDHYIEVNAQKPGRYVLTREKMGTRYAVVIIRTFMDPNDPEDVAAGHRAQDAVKLTQAEPGKLELPDWDEALRQKLHDQLIALRPFVPDVRGTFGSERDTDPVRHLIGTAAGWGGNRIEDAFYVYVYPRNNDGRTPYALTVGDVPVDGFWSVTVYNASGFYEAPENAISVNNVTARKDADGETTIHFGGDPAASNYLRIMPGWNYTVRLYRPRAEILNGTWTFPLARPVT